MGAPRGVLSERVCLSCNHVHRTNAGDVLGDRLDCHNETCPPSSVLVTAVKTGCSYLDDWYSSRGEVTRL